MNPLHTADQQQQQQQTHMLTNRPGTLCLGECPSLKAALALPGLVTTVPTACLRHVTHASTIQGVPFLGLPISPTSGPLGRWPTHDPQDGQPPRIRVFDPHIPSASSSSPPGPAVIWSLWPPVLLTFTSSSLSLYKSSGNSLRRLLYRDSPGAGAAL